MVSSSWCDSYNDVLMKCIKVEVTLPRYRTVNLGALMIGQTVRRSIPIVNRSVLPVTMSVSLSPKDPDCQDISVLRLLTTSQMTLQPPKQQGRRRVEHVTKITVAFSPKKRMKQFVEEVSYCVYSLSAVHWALSNLSLTCTFSSCRDVTDLGCNVHIIIIIVILFARIKQVHTECDNWLGTRHGRVTRLCVWSCGR